jgi:NAD(P)-dependent dehydrogenase (short-subunit alcohol dehydrogenase family)
VAVVDRDPDGAHVADEVDGAGGRGVFVAVDVTDPAQVTRLFEQKIRSLGPLRAAINSAGIAETPGPLHDVTEDDWAKVLAVDLTAVWRCMQHEIRSFLNVGGGVIVNLSSALGLRGGAHRSAYTAAKHGVVGLTRAAALEYAGRNIRVNALCPGVVRTPLVQRELDIDPSREQRYASMSPAQRMGEAAEVADVAAWLCSDAASFVNGAALPVDGGALA